jgi:hypothetical protein
VSLTSKKRFFITSQHPAFSTQNTMSNPGALALAAPPMMNKINAMSLQIDESSDPSEE